MSPVSTNKAAQQHAADLHAHLSQLLRSPAAAHVPDNNGSSPAAQQHAQQALRSLAVTSTKLTGELETNKQQSTEELEELQEACNKREHLLNDLLQQLDKSTQSLRSQLDSCHKLLASQPCMEEPESIIRYAHTLRWAFMPLGKVAGQVPPAPQPHQMMVSALTAFNLEINKNREGRLMSHEAEAQRQQALQQQQEAAAAGAPDRQEAAAAVAEQPPPVPQQVPAAIAWQLGGDLSDDGMETASEDYSEDDDSDDF